ncbi:bactoprenol glucosyl transferase [Pseudomonas sp. 21]|uniref:glycosyltransferase family 2 protein n=1 Tax=unclassified Pseudomonas TaxID=196821 RepID=UPI0005EBBF10|nr:MULTISPECIES: glycosyltransferase family 2 protein [unclassified Pseudomonas]KJK00813.1 bactoprenol glucosyl transferase [Pseudomonas sp. 21]MBV7581676.1 glycosyltransferase family 2 protein [Pseudomonas sp. PDM33]
MKKVISLVVPFYNEQDGVTGFFNRVDLALESIRGVYDLEIICINDGSKDKTLEKLILQAESRSDTRVIDFSRNFGKEAAITAGLDHATGDAVVPIDSDLQHPPESILEMIAQWEAGFEVVLARRVDRDTDLPIHKMTARAFYEVSRYISHINIPADVGDFRLMDRKVVDAIKSLRENCRFMKGLFAWVGFRTTVIDYRVEARRHGQSSFNTWKLWNFALEGITSFSTVPLRIWTYIGGGISILALLYALYLVVKTVIWGVDTPGYASIMVALLLLAGVQLIGIGVLGEYVGRIFMEVKGRPVYIVRKVY